jgi:hypothetical protein
VSAITRFAALALLSTGCILVVSPERYGDHCRFAGATTSQCGACLAQHCQGEIDSECGDDAALAAVESCAVRHDCGAISAAPLASGAAGSCLAGKCGGVCRTLTGTSQTACSEPSLSEGTACTCTSGSTTNDFVCDARAYPSTICCAPKGWPAVGLTCTCSPLDCNPTNDGCACDRLTIAPTGSTCRGDTCCVDQDRCVCRAATATPSGGCYAGETRVDRCTIDVIECAPGQIKVDSCAVR